jgi:hypothetical protein
MLCSIAISVNLAIKFYLIFLSSAALYKV